MKSLATCLAAHKVDPDDRQLINDIHQQLLTARVDPRVAPLQAVVDTINIAIGDYNAIIKQLRRHDKSLEYHPPYEAPASMADVQRDVAEGVATLERTKKAKKPGLHKRNFESVEQVELTEQQVADGTYEPPIQPKPIDEIKVKVKRRRPAPRDEGTDYIQKRDWFDSLVDLERVGGLDARQDVVIKQVFGQLGGVIPVLADVNTLQDFLDKTAEHGGFTSLKDLLKVISAKLHGNDPYKRLADWLLNVDFGADTILVARTSGELLERDPGRALGSYYHVPYVITNKAGVEMDASLRIIALDAEHAADNDTLTRLLKREGQHDLSSLTMRLLLHEAVHAATVHKMALDEKFSQEVDTLRRHMIAHYASKYDMPKSRVIESVYGLRNPLEFLAEMMTDANLQKEAMQVSYTAGDTRAEPGPASTVLHKFIEAVRRFLRVPPTIATVFDRTMLLAESLRVEYSDALGEQSAAYKTIPKVIAEIDEKLYGTDFGGTPSKETTDFISKTKARDAVLGKIVSPIASVLSDNTEQQLADTWAKLRQGGHATAETLLGMLTLDHIQSRFSKLFQRPDNNPLNDYVDAKSREQAVAKKFERSGEHLHAQWLSIEKKHRGQPVMQEFEDMVTDSTVFQVHPDKAWLDPAHDAIRKNKLRAKVAEKAHARLRSTWNKLPPDMKAAYKATREFYRNSLVQMLDTVINNLTSMYGLTDPLLLDAIESAPDTESLLKLEVPLSNWDSLARSIGHMKEMIRKSGPYFPLNRFGNYAISYRKKEVYSGFSSKQKAYDAAQSLASTMPGAVRGKPEKAGGQWQFTMTTEGFQLFENLSDAEAARAALQEDGYEVGGITKKVEMEIPDMSVAGRILAVAAKKLNKDGKVSQAYLEMKSALATMLPDTSFNNRLLRRKNIHGASKNHRRALASYIQAASWQLARLKHRKDVDEALAGLREVGKSRPGQDDGIKTSQVVNEIMRREAINHGDRSKVGEAIAKFGFINFLLTGSYAAINAMQPYLLALPHLGGRFGANRAIGAMSRAYRMVGKDIAGVVMKSRGGLAAFDFVSGDADLNIAVDQIIEVASNENPKLGSMLRELADLGVIDSTFALEVSEAAHSDKRTFLDKVVEAGRMLPFAIEILNRATTAIAAYELEMDRLTKAGFPPAKRHEQATQYAKTAVVKTQIDYSELNRPRHFVRNTVLRAMTMFKIYPLAILQYLALNTRRAMDSNASADERREAATILALTVGTHFTLAGAAGSIFMEPVRLFLMMLTGIFDLEDDEGWQEFIKEPDMMTRNFIYDATGSAKIAETITYGAPRLLDFDMSARVGLQNLMIQWNKQDTWYGTVVGSLVNSLAGPLFGTGQSMQRGMEYLQRGGTVARSLEYFAPKQLRDLLRAYRYSETGMTDWNGRVLARADEFSTYDLAVRAFGFTTAKEANIYEARDYLLRKERGIEKESQALRLRYANAETRREQRAVWEDVQKFNESLPPDMRRAFRLTRRDLVRGVIAKRRAERKTRKGIVVDKKNRAMQHRIRSINP